MDYIVSLYKTDTMPALARVITCRRALKKWDGLSTPYREYSHVRLNLDSNLASNGEEGFFTGDACAGVLRKLRTAREENFIRSL